MWIRRKERPMQPVTRPPINLFDYEPLAKARLEPSAYDYYAGGSEDEVTLHENRAAYTRIKLRPRMLVGVDQIVLATTVLGTPISLPVMVPPVAFHGLAHSDGEIATARGA